MTRPPNPPTVQTAAPGVIDAMSTSYPAMVGYLESVISEVERIIDGTSLMAKTRRKWIKDVIAVARKNVAEADALRSSRVDEIKATIKAETERLAS